MTVDPKVLAQLAAAAYRNASDEDRMAALTGWTQIASYPASGPSDGPSSGFSATAYRGPGGDIVIAFAGTNVESVLDYEMLPANAPVAVGAYSPRVFRATQFAGGQYAASRGEGGDCKNGSAGHRPRDLLGHRAVAVASASLLLRRTA